MTFVVTKYIINQERNRKPNSNCESNTMSYISKNWIISLACYSKSHYLIPRSKIQTLISTNRNPKSMAIPIVAKPANSNPP